MTNLTYIDRTFGTKEEIANYLEQVRRSNMRNYKNKKEFNKIYKVIKKL